VPGTAQEEGQMRTVKMLLLGLLSCAAIAGASLASDNQAPPFWDPDQPHVKPVPKDLDASADRGGLLPNVGDCADYIDLSGQPLPITVTGTTAGATNDYGPFSSRPSSWQLGWLPASAAGRDKTYKWIVPFDGRFTFSLKGSSYDTSLLLYNFTCPQEPTYPTDFICGNDDAGESLQSELYCLPFHAGQRLLIVVDGYGASYGSYQLKISEYRPAADLASFITTTMGAYHIPGVSACCIRNGAVTWSGSYGNADISHGVAATDSTLFMMASISKTFVGVALMQLWERGLFDLDDDINQYLPWAVHDPFYPGYPITFRMLMSHTSGIRDNWNVLDPLVTWDGDSPIRLEDFLRNYLIPGGTYYNQASNFGNHIPGRVCKYCNVGAALAGYLVERINPGALSLEDYCQQEIFGPLGMTNSSWFLANLDIEDVAVPYRWGGSSFIAYQQYGVPYYPASQLRTGSDQLARHLIAFMQHGVIGGTRILDPATVDTMTTVESVDPDAGASNGLFWRTTVWGGRTLWGHPGSFAGVENLMFYCPAENTGAIVLTNGESTYGSFLIMNELLERAAVSAVPFDAADCGVPREVTLYPNQPNPFNPATTISYYLPSSADIGVDVFNVVGQRVETLFHGRQGGGLHSVMWDATNSAAGIYFVCLQAGNLTQTRRLVLVR